MSSKAVVVDASAPAERRRSPPTEEKQGSFTPRATSDDEGDELSDDDAKERLRCGGADDARPGGMPSSSSPSSAVATTTEGTRGTRVVVHREPPRASGERLVEGPSGRDGKAVEQSVRDDAGAAADGIARGGRRSASAQRRAAEGKDEPDADADVSNRKEGGDGGGSARETVRSGSALTPSSASTVGVIDPSDDDDDRAMAESFADESFGSETFGGRNAPRSIPGAYSIVPGSGGSGRRRRGASADGFRSGSGNADAWNDRFSIRSSLRGSPMSDDAAQPLIVAAYVPDEEERGDALSSEAPVTVVATKDSWIDFVRRSRRTKAGIAFFILAIVAMSVGLVVSNHRSGGGEAGNSSDARPAWVQVGSDVDGPPGSKFGSSVSLSRDGKRLAIAGSGYFDDDGSSRTSIRHRGFVQVYELQTEGGGRTWTPLGSNLLAGNANNFHTASSPIATEFGERAIVSLSGDGKRVALSASFHSPSISARGVGRLAIFEHYKRTNIWSRLGQIIEGQKEYEYLGAAMHLSSNGAVVAVGSPGYSGNDKNENNIGRVQLFKVDTGAPMGGHILGRSMCEFSGGSLSLSQDGRVIAIGNVVSKGTIVNQTAIRVFEFEAGNWTQKGNDIAATPSGSHDIGWIASMSKDGDVIAASNYYVGGNVDSFDPGNATDLLLLVYRYEGGKWIQLNQDFHPSTKGRIGFDSSYVVSLSSDGKALALGVCGHGGNAGWVNFFKKNEDGDEWLAKDVLEGESPNDQFGADVSVSSDLQLVAIGAPHDRRLGFEHGCARVFEKKQQETLSTLRNNVDRSKQM